MEKRFPSRSEKVAINTGQSRDDSNFPCKKRGGLRRPYKYHTSMVNPGGLTMLPLNFWRPKSLRTAAFVTCVADTVG